MALELSDQYVPAQSLTGYIRQALADQALNTFSLSQYLADTAVDDIDFRADVGGGGLARVASYRAFDAESPIGRREGIQRVTGSLPPISEKVRLSEYDRLKLRKLDAGIEDAIYKDAEVLARNIAARAEVARGEALQDGKVTIEENGLRLDADFGRADDLTQVAATKWGANGNVIEDLESWREIYEAHGNGSPGVAVVSRQIMAAIIRNDTVRQQVYGANDQSARLVTQADLNSLLASFGLPSLQVYGVQVAGSDGTPRPVLDPTKVLFLPASTEKIGETLWGTTAEALDPNYGIDATEAPGIVCGSYSDNDPVGMWTKASAIMLPVVPNTNLTLSAQVL